MDTLFVILIFLCALSSGLMAGVFFAFSNFVMRALARLRPSEGMRAMQAINVTVLNPLFLSIFMGTGAISLVAIVMALLRWQGSSTCTLLGGGVYLLGSILVTLRGNVPLNNALVALDADAPDSASRWSDYVRDWTRWNHVRTIACAAASVLFILAINDAVLDTSLAAAHVALRQVHHLADRLAAEDVDVVVRHFLVAVRAAVGDQAVAGLRDAEILRDL